MPTRLPARFEPPTTDEFFIIWNPTSSEPPTKRFPTAAAAEATARIMARRFQGEQFYVLKATAVAQVESVSFRRIL